MPVQMLEFLGIFGRVYIGKERIQFIGHVKAVVLHACFGDKVVIDIVGHGKIKKILDGNAVQLGKVVQGIGRGIDPARLIVGIGLSGDVQMGSYEFL